MESQSKKNKLRGGTHSKNLVAPFSGLKILIKTISVREPLSKLQSFSSLGLPKEARSRIIYKVLVIVIQVYKYSKLVLY